MTGRVIVVGSVNVDLVVTTERLPRPGETVIGGRFERHHGGKGGNQAVAAARLGAPTWFVGAVGGDRFGTEAREALEAEGIDVTGVLTLPGEATGVALIVVDETGENSIAVAGGANAALSSVQVRAALKGLELTAADVVLVGHEIRTGATHEALRLGRIAGATTILNPAPAGGLGQATLDLADVLTPNETELGASRGTGQYVRARQGLARERAGSARGPGESRGEGGVAGGGPPGAGHRRAPGRRRRHRGRGRHPQRRAGGGPRRRSGPGRSGTSGRGRRVARGHQGGRSRGHADQVGTRGRQLAGHSRAS